MSQKILKYSVAWSPKHERGVIRIKTRSKTGNIEFSNPQSFVAALQILQWDDDPHISKDGWIITGLEAPGFPE